MQKLLLIISIFTFSLTNAQVSESFNNIPTTSSASYSTRNWTGDDGFAWQATNARTDKTLNGKAITIRGGNGHLINNGGSIANGCGTLSFDYKRVFGGNSTMKVYINGTQYGGDIDVSLTTASTFSEVVNVSGDIDIEIKNTTSGKKIVIDNLSWTSFSGSTNTELELDSATYTQTESGGSVDLCVNITNESSTTATTADIVLTSGNSPHLTSYTTQTVTFPAGSTAQQCVTVNIIDNETCDGNIDYNFEIQNISGGDSAVIGAQNATQLTITDNEMSSGTILFNSFETSGDTWTPATFSTPACTSGGDQWDYDTSLSSITPSHGSQFWGIKDLDGNCGGSAYETITFPSIDITSYTDVSISFDYYTIGFDSPDHLGYEIWEDGVKTVDLIDLNKNSEGWLTITHNVANSVSNVYLVLKAKQNVGDYGAFDNVILTGNSCSTCIEPTTDATFHIDSPENLTTTSATLNWTNGDGENRIVVMREANAVTFIPSDNTSYVSNSVFVGLRRYSPSL